MTLTPEEKKRVLRILDDYIDSKEQHVFDVTRIGRRIQDGLSSLMSGSNSVEAQRMAAIGIIREGQKSGVDEIEITMSHKAGLSLGSNVNGIPIEATAGISGNMIIKVKYKR
jgi:hypothetical protein